MKPLRLIFISWFLVVLLLPAWGRGAEISTADFYRALAPYGNWVQVEKFGYCFQPRVNETWRPYTDGYWAASNLGWAWVSNEAWGWATYHYGRWMLLRNRGWVWLPGREWAPAWVSWRSGKNYIGWAPLPPATTWDKREIVLGKNFPDVGPYYYNFCSPHNFAAQNLPAVLLPIAQNIDVLPETQNITWMVKMSAQGGNEIYNYGPSLKMLAQASEVPIPQVQIEREEKVALPAAPQEVVRNQVRNGRFFVVAPRVLPAEKTEKPPTVSTELTQADTDDGYARVQDRKKAAEVRERIRLQVAEQEKRRTQVTSDYLLERQRAGLEQQTEASQQLQQNRMAHERQVTGARQQVLNLQQLQRVNDQNTIRQQTQIQQQQFDFQRLERQAQVSDLPGQQAEAQVGNLNLQQKSQQNRIDALGQQRELQQMQMQIQLQQNLNDNSYKQQQLQLIQQQQNPMGH